MFEENDENKESKAWLMQATAKRAFSLLGNDDNLVLIPVA
jgi:hypothetical protein